MSKLLKLKQWLTVNDAAKRISISADEEITEADILQLALDGHLTLSVYFVNHTRGRLGKIIPYEDTEWHFLKVPANTLEKKQKAEYEIDNRPIPPALEKLYRDHPNSNELGYIASTDNLCINEETYISLEDKISTITGVWDLPMWGAEALDVEHRFHSLTGGPSVTLIQLNGAFIKNESGAVCQLHDKFGNDTYIGSKLHIENLKLEFAKNNTLPEEAEKILASTAAHRQKILKQKENTNDINNYYPAGALPEDSIFVVRSSSLMELERALTPETEKPEKPLHPSERKSSTQIIAALAAMAKLDLCKPYVADEVLRVVAANCHLELPNSPETVVKFLKAAADLNGKP